jgi:hypothetical protein
MVIEFMELILKIFITQEMEISLEIIKTSKHISQEKFWMSIIYHILNQKV